MGVPALNQRGSPLLEVTLSLVLCLSPKPLLGHFLLVPGLCEGTAVCLALQR